MPPRKKQRIWSTPSRYDYKARGEWFVTWLITALLVLTVVYLVLHKFVPRPPTPGLEQMVSLGGDGQVTVLDPFAVDWYVGETRAKAVLERASRRFVEMEQVRLELDRDLAVTRQRAGPDFMARLNEVDILFVNSRFKEAARAFGLLTEGLARTTRESRFGENLIVELRLKLLRLALLKSSQEAEIASLRPSVTSSIFWTDPVYSLAEVLFFALFGVLTNLLMVTADFVRKGGYKPSERWVGYTKLAYGPILALIVVMAIMNGWIDPKYETRVWTLPLVGFILGYASRRTAALVDRCSEAFLGKATESIEKGPEAAASGRIERANALLEATRPTSLRELKTEGEKLVQELVKAQVTKREAQV